MAAPIIACGHSVESSRCAKEIALDTPPTLIWRNNALELIDQRRLPHQIDYVRCVDAAAVAQSINRMVVRGAPAIGCAAAYGIALAALEACTRAETLRPTLEAADRLLRASRPTAINLAWALDRMAHCARSITDQSLGEQAATLLAEAHRITAEDLAANQAMGALGAPLLPQGARVMTHCNAGALATAGHGTALGVIRSAWMAGNPLSVIANETRPYLQGARLTAWELQSAGIPVTLVTDNMAGHLMQRGRIDAVIVGADRIAANGDTANKIGTYTLAVLAARHRIPFYVAAPLSTFDAATADASGIPIEERDGIEVTGYGGLAWAPADIAVFNPAFDVTPAELITAIITEQGIARAPLGQALAALAHTTNPTPVEYRSGG